MRWTIRQNGDTWQTYLDGRPVGQPQARYELALGVLVASAGMPLTAAGAETGLLDDAWESIEGLAFSEATGDGRDFSSCAWSWRDPSVSLLPLMLQTSTEMGHFGAELAGFIEQLALSGGTTTGRGRFYDSEVGIQFRDLLAGSGRFGVSVDPGSVDAEWSCVQEDADGWCVEDRVDFHSYQIIGVTGTPFPGFERAAIRLAGAATTEGPVDATVADAEAAVVASAFPITPPRRFLEMPEPEWGSDLLVEQLDEHGQPNGSFAVPLTIVTDGPDAGLVYGHMFYLGQCHTGFLDLGICREPPQSPSNYARFNLRPLPVDDGGSVLTGPLVVGCDHADLSLFEDQARDHYANAGVAWADVHVTEGVFGAWFCGALRPDVTPEQLRVLQASSVSGDWRPHPAGLEMILGLTVNGPGFPIRGAAREASLAAAGLAMVASAQPRVRAVDQQITALVAANVVRSTCSDCADRARLRASHGDGDQVLDDVRATLALLERRTRHLVPAAAGDAMARIQRSTAR